jgi:D-threo-aldose 1-dehydrogenase
MMSTRPSPRGVRLTDVGFGAAQLGNLGRVTTDDEAAGAVEEAWRRGIRYFDTAPHYGLGLSERRLGAALAARPRDEYVISTKVGRLLEPNEPPHGTDDGFVVPATHRRVFDFSRDAILRSVDESLARLGLDRVDILYLHDPDHEWEAASTTGVDTLIELRDQGVTRAIGAGMNQSAMLARFVRECDVDVVMLAGRYTLLEQGAAEDLLPAALDRGVAVIAAAVYNSGLLSADRPAAGLTYDYLPAPESLIERVTRIAEVCERHGVRLPEAAVQFPLRHPATASVVVGMRTADQVDSTLDRLAARIPVALWDDLRATGLLVADDAIDTVAP